MSSGMDDPTTPRFEAILTPRRYQQVADKISEEIDAGRLAAGSRLPPERELAVQFGVSRPTIREALIALEIMDLIEIRPGAGIFVKASPPARSGVQPVTGPGPFEILEARRIVEGEIAALVAPQISERTIARLEDCIALMVEENAADYTSYVGDRRFHETIAAETQNSALVDIVKYFWEQRSTAPLSLRLHEQVAPAEIRLKAVDEHRLIVDAFRSHSAEAARRAMQRHMTRVMRALLTRWQALTAEEPETAKLANATIVQRIPREELGA